MAKNDTPKGVKCSFCGKTQESVRKIIAGPGVYICNECIGLCNEIIESEYYEDDNGYAIKSDYMELVDIYQNINDNDDKRYITYLLNKMKKDIIRLLETEN